MIRGTQVEKFAICNMTPFQKSHGRGVKLHLSCAVRYREQFALKITSIAWNVQILGHFCNMTPPHVWLRGSYYPPQESSRRDASIGTKIGSRVQAVLEISRFEIWHPVKWPLIKIRASSSTRVLLPLQPPKNRLTISSTVWPQFKKQDWLH